MTEERTLRYTANDNEYVFFYGEEVLFYNSKSNPFLYITLEDEGVKKELPLSSCEIAKIGNDGYKIKFFNKNCAVNIKITAIKKALIFEFTKLGFFGETLSINLYRKKAKIKGMGLNPYRDLNQTWCDKNGFYQQKEYTETKPCFSVKSSYFFKTTDIEDYKIYFYESSVKINTKQKGGHFYLEFDKRFDLDEKQNILRFCSQKEAINYAKQEKIYDGFITPYQEDPLFYEWVHQIRKRGYKYYLIFSPVITKEDAEFSKYDPEGLVETNGEYIIDLKNENNFRLLKNKIRHYFDTNADGFYIDEKAIECENKDKNKNLFLGKNVHEIIFLINCEYMEKDHIYNKLYLDERNNESFSVPYQKIKEKERAYSKSLQCSGNKAFYYECSEKEYLSLRDNKKQLIIR